MTRGQMHERIRQLEKERRELLKRLEDTTDLLGKLQLRYDLDEAKFGFWSRLRFLVGI